MSPTGVAVADDVTASLDDPGGVARRDDAELCQQHAQPAPVRRIQREPACRFCTRVPLSDGRRRPRWHYGEG